MKQFRPCTFRQHETVCQKSELPRHERKGKRERGKEKIKHLLLEELESDLGDDAFEEPAWLLVQLHNLGERLGQRSLLWRELRLQNAAEELDPGGHLALLAQVWHDFDLDQRTNLKLKNQKEEK